MNFRRARANQALDRDIMYHDVGQSMTHAREADIIIIGHSMALFGLDWQTLQAFSEEHGLKIFNLASGGDISGEFLLRVAQRNRLRPKIWIINADDLTGTEFFSDYVSAIAKGEAADVMSYGWTRAVLNTISKNMKWRFEILLRDIFPRSIAALIYPVSPIFNYRSSLHGNWRNDSWPGYMAENNPPVINTREPDCHATPQVIAAAKRYVDRLGSGRIMLTLVPHTTSCRTRVEEIAEALKIPFLSVDWHGMTSFDGGGHLDSKGAKRFTEMMLQALERNLDY